MGLFNTIFSSASKIDERAFGNLTSVFSLINKLKNEDEGNFIYFQVVGMSLNHDAVALKNADQVFIRLFYCGEIVVWAWEKDYSQYQEYKRCFNMFKEENGYYFCTKVKLNGSDAVAILNKALTESGYCANFDAKTKSFQISLY